MDGAQFDRFVRSRVTGTGRRQVLRSLGLGLLGSASLAAVAENSHVEAASNSCRGGCGPCGQCQPGKCQRKHGKKKCKPGTCVTKANGAACGTNGACKNGTCAEVPTCLGVGMTCDGVGTCCSGICTVIDLALSYCERGGIGAQCYIDDDCESQDCQDFRCT